MDNNGAIHGAPKGGLPVHLSSASAPRRALLFADLKHFFISIYSLLSRRPGAPAAILKLLEIAREKPVFLPLFYNGNYN